MVSSAKTASVISVSTPLLTPAEKHACFERHHADFVDCESAAFASVCEAAGVPWAVVRAVSDAWNDNLPPKVQNWVSASGATRPLRVVIDLLRSPSLIPPTVALGSRSKAALREAGKRLNGLVELAMTLAHKPANNLRK